MKTHILLHRVGQGAPIPIVVRVDKILYVDGLCFTTPCKPYEETRDDTLRAYVKIEDGPLLYVNINAAQIEARINS